jgi:hypothetical protein
MPWPFDPAALRRRAAPEPERDGAADAAPSLGDDRRRPGRVLAVQPEAGRPHGARLPAAHVPGLGRAVHGVLQRRVCPRHRRQERSAGSAAMRAAPGPKSGRPSVRCSSVSGRASPWATRDLPLSINRYGYFETCYFTFSYSPVYGESRRVGGVLVTFVETTSNVMAERRHAFQLPWPTSCAARPRPNALLRATGRQRQRAMPPARWRSTRPSTRRPRRP